MPKFLPVVLLILFMLIPVISYANSISYSIQEVEAYLGHMRSKEFLADSKDEELKVQDELFVPTQEMSASEASNTNKEEEPTDE